MKRWREQEGITQAEAADVFGMSRKGYNEIETGRAPIAKRTAMAVYLAFSHPNTYDAEVFDFWGVDNMGD